KRLEAIRDQRQERHPYFEFGEVLLQIAIVSASVSILSTSRPMFWFSLVLALVGAAFAVNGFVPVFKLPFLHHQWRAPGRLAPQAPGSRPVACEIIGRRWRSPSPPVPPWRGRWLGRGSSAFSTVLAVAPVSASVASLSPFVIAQLGPEPLLQVAH